MNLSSRRARLAAAAALALVVGVPASLGATGLAAKVVGLSDSTPTAAQYPSSKVTICHHTHSKTNPFVTITVSQNALPAHMGHGDTVGPCTPPAAPVAAATSQKLKKAHKAKHNAGKSSLHGQHGKPAAAAKVKTHGRSGETHGQSTAPTTGSTTVHGKSHSTTHGQGAAHRSTHGKGQANGKSQTTHGKSGQVHGNGQGQGQGQGNGQGQEEGGTHGNGGGNGKGH